MKVLVKWRTITAAALIGFVVGDIAGSWSADSLKAKAAKVDEAEQMMQRATVQIAASAIDVAGIYMVATVLANEAKGESLHGKKACASVMWNRADGNPSNLANVVTATNWLGKAMTGRKELVQCLDITIDMYNRHFKPVGGWTHFYNPNLATPEWGKQLEEPTRIDKHIFGTLQEAK